MDSVIISSVRKEMPVAIQQLSKKYHHILLNYKTKIPIVNAYKTPRTLGLDRLAGAVGAHSLYPKKNILILDLGTCIKYDYIDKGGIYHGGNIAPGLNMRIESMHHFTSKLPLVKKKFNENIIGNSTISALQNGAVWGIKCEIEGFISYLTQKKQKFSTILTGGDAQYFGEIIDSKIFVVPNLVMIGLNEILLLNQ